MTKKTTFKSFMRAQADKDEQFELEVKKKKNKLTISHDNYTILLPNGRPVRFALCYDKSRLDSNGRRIQMTRFKWFTMFDEIRHHMEADKKYRLPLMDGRTIGDQKILFADFDKLDERFIDPELPTSVQWDNFYNYLEKQYSYYGTTFRSPSGKCKVAFIAQVSNPYRLITDTIGAQYLKEVLLPVDYELIDHKGIYRCFLTEPILNSLQQLIDKPHGYIVNDIVSSRSRNRIDNYDPMTDPKKYSTDYYTVDNYKHRSSTDYYTELNYSRSYINAYNVVEAELRAEYDMLCNDPKSEYYIDRNSNSNTVSSSIDHVSSDHSNCNSNSNSNVNKIITESFIEGIAPKGQRPFIINHSLSNNSNSSNDKFSARGGIDNSVPPCNCEVTDCKSDYKLSCDNCNSNSSTVNFSARERIDNSVPLVIAEKVYDPYTILQTYKLNDSTLLEIIKDSKRKHMPMFLHFLLEHPSFASSRGYAISREKLAVTFNTSRTGANRLIETAIKLGILEECNIVKHKWGARTLNFIPKLRAKCYRVTGKLLDYMLRLHKGDSRLQSKDLTLPKPEKVVFEEGNTQDMMFSLALAGAVNGLTESQWTDYYTRIPGIQFNRRWYHMKYNYDSVKSWMLLKKSGDMFTSKQ